MSTDEETTLADFIDEKICNLVDLILQNVEFLGEFQKRKEAYGDNLKTAIVQELKFSYPILITVLADKHKWTYDRIEAAENNEQEWKQILKDGQELLENVSAKGLKFEEGMKLKDNVEQKDFYFRLFRYYKFFAKVILVLLPEELSKTESD